MRQSKGTGGDNGDIWPDAAALVIQHCATLARAWECTNDGLTLIEKTGERIYSLVMIYQLAADVDLQGRAAKAVLGAISDPGQWPYIAEYAGVDLMDSIKYLRGEWLNTATDAKTTQLGVSLNITRALSPFASNMHLRNAFASGRGQRLMNISEAWGSICLINVSSLEYGIAGRIVNVMLKSLLYTEARKREMANPAIGFSERLLFLADEFQDLITADVTGMSDSNFWNVARSTGTIGFVSTQGMASLEQAIGRTPAYNFALQMRSKIVLRVEDPATMEYTITLAGKTLRSYVFKRDRYESFEALVREQGYNPLKSGPARIVELPSNYIGALSAGWFQIHKSSLPISFDTWRATVDLDERFIPSGTLAHPASEETVLAARQAAHWRQEDKIDEDKKAGNHETDVLREDDLIDMGRFHAYAYIQRAGMAHQDLIEIG